ncbi:unnamed protein product [Victoria cruziana]
MGMEIMRCRLIRLSVLLMTIFPAVHPPVSAQLVTPCTISMFNGFTACLRYVIGIGDGGRSPSTDCCQALGSMVNSSSGCLCLILSANPPLQTLIDQALSVVFPQACRMPASTVQCQAVPPMATTDASAPATAAPPPVPVEVVPPPALSSPATLGTGGQRRVPNSAQKIHAFSFLFLFALLILEAIQHL